MARTPTLSMRSLVLAKVETTYNVDAAPTVSADAYLADSADIRPDNNVLERKFYRTSLSALPFAIGRKLVHLTFKHEIKGSGVAGKVPKLGTLLRGCGFAQTTVANNLASVIQAPVASVLNTGPAVTWANTTLPTTNYGRYKVKVVLGGPSATAKLLVTGNPSDNDDTSILYSDVFEAVVMAAGTAGTIVTVDNVTNPLVPTFTISGTPVAGEKIVATCGGVRVLYTVGASPTTTTVATDLTAALTAAAAGRWTVASSTNVVSLTIVAGVTGALTSGTTAVTLGASGAQVTPSWTGSLVLNDSFTIDLWKPGFRYTPISTGFESLTIWVYYDGIVHRVTGCMGNVSFSAEAGKFGEATFTYTGQYIEPVDAPLPTGMVYETSIPQQVELAQLQLGFAKKIHSMSYTIDMGIQTQPRDSVSHPDGYDGVQYVSRNPTGGFNPEMALQSEEPYWTNLALARMLPFSGRVGTVPNNTVEFKSNSVQMSNITYGDRNSNRIYDISLAFKQDSTNGDDELAIVFS